MHPSLIVQNYQSLLLILKLFTQISLLIKLRRAAGSHKRHRILTMFLRTHALLVPALLNLMYLIYKLLKLRKGRKLLTKPHSLICLLNRYR